ncbi:MAG: hypothetical protein KDC92_07115 [Bacteroidetes bacterium]|nr:hypothetical protein [Bacteroidota bacterium]
MPTIKTQFNPDVSVELYRGYYHFHRKQQLKKIPINLLIILAAALIATGTVLEIQFIALLGVIITVSLLSFMGWLYYSVGRATNSIKKFLDSEDLSPQHDYSFGFDDNGLKYNYNGDKSTVGWNRFKYHQQNGNDLYLFNAKKKIVEIISTQIIGNEPFEEFVNLVKAKNIPELYPKA